MERLIKKMLLSGISIRQIIEFAADYERKEDDEKQAFIRAASLLLD